MSAPSQTPSPLDPTVTQAPKAGPAKPPASPNAGPAVSPARLGRYRLDEQIGAGGMGAVFKAFHLSLKRTVALKVMHAPRAGDELFAARFHREMEAVGRLDHPNVVRATDAGEEDGVLFLVMEYVDGIDLDRLVRQVGPLPAADACELIRQAALGLEYIRQQGLLHRDIKPSNLVLSRDGVVKILDLGLARLRGEAAEGQELTPSGCAMGTADYLAPEQADDARRVDIRADIYSLGCTLYKLLTGRPPFAGPRYASMAQKIRGHCQDPFPPLPEGRGAPAGLGAVVLKMTDKDRNRRFASPLEVAASLAPMAAGGDPCALLQRARDGAPAASPPEQIPDIPNSEPPTPSSPAPETAPGVITTRSDVRRPTRHALAWVAAVTTALAVIAVVFWAWRTWGGGAGTGPPPANLSSPPTELGPALPQQPRSLDDCTPLRWYDLLDREPVPALWSPEDGLSSRNYDHGLEQLTVNTTRTGLFQLGTVSKGNYILQIGVSQANWTGGAGIYLGYREVPPPPGPPQPDRTTAQFQFLSFRPRAAQGIEFLTLARGEATVRFDKDGKRRVDTDLMMAQDAPSIHREQVIEVTISGLRMQQVSLNGAPLDKLVGQDVNAQFSPDDYRGPFGTVNAASSSVYRNARFMIHEGF